MYMSLKTISMSIIVGVSNYYSPVCPPETVEKRYIVCLSTL